MDDVVLRLVAGAVGRDVADVGSVGGLSNGGRGSSGSRSAGGGRRREGDSDGLLAGDAEGERDDLGNVGLRAVDLDLDAKGLSEEAEGLETLLVVRSTTTDEDLDLVVDERLLELLERLDDALEGGGDIGEVGDSTSNDEDLALGVDVATADEADWWEEARGLETD